MAFLPDGRALVTERAGRLRLVNLRTSTLSGPITGLPPIAARGQGGLLGLALHPDFARTREVFLCFAEARDGGTGTSVFRAKLSGNAAQLEEGQVIFRQMPAGNTTRHFGCRLVFDRNGHLFITLGDRGNMMDEAQNLANHIGKVIRLRTDGTVPADNPFVNRPAPCRRSGPMATAMCRVRPCTRKPGSSTRSSMARAAGTRSTAPKPARTMAGRSSLTASITQAPRSAAAPIARHGTADLLLGPVHRAVGRRGLYRGQVPGLARQSAHRCVGGGPAVRLELRNGQVIGETRYLETRRERIRDVVQGPDGYIYLLTDEDQGQMLRLVPR